MRKHSHGDEIVCTCAHIRELISGLLRIDMYSAESIGPCVYAPWQEQSEQTCAVLRCGDGFVHMPVKQREPEPISYACSGAKTQARRVFTHSSSCSIPEARETKIPQYKKDDFFIMCAQ